MSIEHINHIIFKQSTFHCHVNLPMNATNFEVPPQTTVMFPSYILWIWLKTKETSNTMFRAKETCWNRWCFFMFQGYCPRTLGITPYDFFVYHCLTVSPLNTNTIWYIFKANDLTIKFQPSLLVGPCLLLCACLNSEIGQFGVNTNCQSFTVSKNI